jgi:hypothetical protein
MTTFYSQYENGNKIVLYDKNNDGERINEKKYKKSEDSLQPLIDLVKTPLKIIVTLKDPDSERLKVENAPVDGFVFDLAYINENQMINGKLYHSPKFNVKKIGLWDMVGHVDGPMDFLTLKTKYNIYKDIYSGGKTRRRRRAKKASRKSRRNRKR